MNGQVLKPMESRSSPSRISVLNGSSAWLHWNYTYPRDGRYPGGVIMTNYIEQIIGFKTDSQPSIQVIAKRTGKNGLLTLQSPMPAPFNGRVEVISSNSTLVIHGLQYNDSSYQFSSNVKVNVNRGAGPVLNTFELKPNITITVNGMKNFENK